MLISHVLDFSTEEELKEWPEPLLSVRELVKYFDPKFRGARDRYGSRASVSVRELVRSIST